MTPARTLPDAYQRIRHERRFILWREETNPRGGKPNKVPVARDGRTHINHLSPGAWMTGDEAEAAALALPVGDPVGVGMVFARAEGLTPLAFIDLDQCLDEQGEVCDRLALDITNETRGMIETSVSGRGLHIIGRGQVLDTHKNRRKGLSVEIYDDGRFMAIGHGQSGDITQDITPTVHQVQRELIGERSVAEASDDWPTRDPRCTAPDDDDALIGIMLAAPHTIRGRFGRGVTFRDLWEGDTDALADAFPSDHDDFDHSAADMALASQLGFFTGNDAERALRLMGRSALADRDKWRERPAYRRSTIKAGCNRDQVYTVPARRQPSDPDSVGVAGDILALSQQIEFFKHVWYVKDRGEVFDMRTGAFYDKEGFNNAFSDRFFELGDDAQAASGRARITDDAWKAFVRSKAPAWPIEARHVDGTTFDPARDFGEAIQDDHTGRRLLNIYDPSKHGPMAPGDVSLWEQFLAGIIPNPLDRLTLEWFLAAWVQHRGEKFQWAPFVQGPQGNGKTFLIEVMQRCLGEDYTYTPKAKELGDSGAKFNGWMANKTGILVDEAYTRDRRDNLDTYKEWITNSRIEVQSKGRDQRMIRNVANFMFVSNSKEGIPIERGDRRYAPFFTVKPAGWEAFMGKLWAWAKAGGFAHIHHHLSTLSIPAPYNPAPSVQATLANPRLEAPVTSSLAEAHAASMSPGAATIREAIASEEYGFRGGIISGFRAKEFLRASGRHVGDKLLPTIMAEAGLVRHPALGGEKPGRANRAIQGEGGRGDCPGKPTLYVERDEVARHRFATDPAGDYLKAQKPTEIENASGL